MQDIPSAHLAMPLGLSGLLAAGLVAAMGRVMSTDADAGAGGATAVGAAAETGTAVLTLVQRLLDSPFVVLILFVGLWAFLFGLLHLWAFQADSRGVMARLAGHAGPTAAPVATSDASLTASLFAERWDHLSAMRMAPLSYAIWGLPLLGFIGTVIGISGAIGDLGSVFGDTDREEALASVLAELQFAFDTTFAGLVLVMPVMALSTVVSLKSDAARDAALAARFGRQDGPHHGGT